MGLKKSGELTHELEVSVPASKAWELYGTLKLGELASQKSLTGMVSKAEVHGDGSVGTTIEINFSDSMPGPIRYFQEKITKVDHANMVKETEHIRGGYLDLGFATYRITLRIVGNPDDDGSCVIRSSIYYEYDPDSVSVSVSVSDPDSLISTDTLVAMALAAKDYLTANNM